VGNDTEGAGFDPASIRFGTDGWRAIIGEDFTVEHLARVAEAAALVFREDNPGFDAAIAAPDTLAGTADSDTSAATALAALPLLYVGYDCRENAGSYAVLAAVILASYGFRVLISDRYCPTPALCWSIAHNPQAVGGLILTSSHNPAEYLGVKLRMPDGGASPKSFSDRVEAALSSELPAVFALAWTCAEANRAAGEGAAPLATAQIVTAPSAPEQADASLEHSSEALHDNSEGLPIERVDILTPYLKDLASLVDADAIAAAELRVVVDPMFGAGRGYLAGVLSSLGVEVVEIHAGEDPSFAGLHPEPIFPWIAEALARTAELGYDACFITDGDADRIGAGARDGSFVNPHRILALVCGLLVEDRGERGRVVRTLSGSSLIKRQCERLGLELTTTPVGFKWIYEEMLRGDVILGGEESGGIGIPSHVRERDGLLMALLLTEMMARKGKDLGALVEELLDTLGHLEYARRDLRLSEEEKQRFLCEVCAAELGTEAYQARFAALGERLVEIDYRDGIKFDCASDAWLLARASGTEPLVRVYAEAASVEQVENLLDLGCSLVKGIGA
jgi:phosphomannomutase